MEKNLYLYMLFNLIVMIFLILFVLMGVAYLTLLERKILGYIQDRKGPNKLGIWGIFQPFSEGVKLFSKELILIMKSSLMLFYLSPILSMFFMLIIWMVYFISTNIYFMNYSILFMVLVLSLNSYIYMIMGWSSGSLYSMIGAIRSVVQVLSYEVSFIMIIFIQMILSESYSLMEFMSWQIYISFMWILMPLFLVYFLSILAELNRSPMDFIEGESELVSGFNIEYFSSLFMLVFLSEYGMIIFMSYIIMYLYMGSGMMMMSMNFLKLNLMVLLIIFMRGILPRMRYDELMYLCWKIILPLVLCYLMFFINYKMLLGLMY